MLKDELYWVKVCNETKKTMPMKCKICFVIYEGDTNKMEIMDIDTLTTSISHKYFVKSDKGSKASGKANECAMTTQIGWQNTWL